ncbi:MAG: hypothetical protein AAF429_14850 [Pseudomonadota bacterium]
MLDRLSEQELPVGSILVECGGSDVYHFPFCGLDYVYIKGGIVEESGGSYKDWFYFSNLEGLFDQILDHVISSSDRRGDSEFTFLRKFLGLTIEELARVPGADFEVLTKWSKGKGFLNSESFEFVISLCKLKRDGSLNPRTLIERDGLGRVS